MNDVPSILQVASFNCKDNELCMEGLESDDNNDSAPGNAMPNPEVVGQVWTW